jgi:hypothetical protein
VLAHREAVVAENDGQSVSGDVEIDGAYFDGYVKPANNKADRRDRRLWVNQNGKRRCVVIMRECNGRTLPFVFRSEETSPPTIREHVAPNSTIYAETEPKTHDRFKIRSLSIPLLRKSHFGPSFSANC